MCSNCNIEIFKGQVFIDLLLGSSEDEQLTYY